MGREFPTKVGGRVKTIGIVAFLIFSMAVFCFAVASGRIRVEPFGPYAQVKGGLFEKGFDFAL